MNHVGGYHLFRCSIQPRDVTCSIIYSSGNFRFSPVLQTMFLIRSVYVKSQSIAWTSNRTFWWAEQTQTEWVILEPARTHHFGLKAQTFVNPIFTFVWFSLKAVYNSCNLQRLLQVAKFLIIYSITHTNIAFFSGTYLLKL